MNKSNTKEVLDLFTELHNEGQGIILVTHDKEAALRGNHIIYIEDGAIVSELSLPDYHEKDKEREKLLSGFLEKLKW